MRVFKIKDEINICDVSFAIVGVSIALSAIVSLVGCHDNCEPDTTRCNGDRVEICNSSADWELEADCSEIDDFGLGLEWTCCLDPEDGLHSCLPIDNCDGGVR